MKKRDRGHEEHRRDRGVPLHKGKVQKAKETSCDKKFDTDHGAKIQMGHIHTDTSKTYGATAKVNDIVCKFCDKKYDTENGLKIHMGRCHKVTNGKQDSIVDIAHTKFGCLERAVQKDKRPVNEAACATLKREQQDFRLCQKDIGIAAEVINKFTYSFISKLNEISSLRWSTFKSGSYYDKTKNDFPDEFDIMIYPDVQVSVDFKNKSTPGFYKVKLVSVRLKELENITDKDGYLLPEKFKAYAFRMFAKVLDEIPEGRAGRTKRITKSSSSPAYTIYYKAIPKKPIDIDLVPSFRIEGWPVDIARRVNPKWITSDKVVNDAMMSYDVVCKTYPEDIPEKCLLWRLSFSLTEKMLVKHANCEDPTMFRKKAHRFVKMCIQDIKHENPEKIKKFSSYCVKQFMFGQYDNWPTKVTPQIVIQRNILDQLICALSSTPLIIRNYFIETDNVIKFVPLREINLIVKGLKEKVKSLQ